MAAASLNDVMLVYLYAIPVFVFFGLTSTVVGRRRSNKASPGHPRHARRQPDRRASWPRRLRSWSGFYSAVATYRFGLDPDNHGIPLVTSSLDLLGALSLILAIVILGLA